MKCNFGLVRGPSSNTWSLEDLQVGQDIPEWTK